MPFCKSARPVYITRKIRRSLMCNMAAYAGRGPAAPVLLRMLEKQEGLWGGHFTGISTIHQGRVHTVRVCGDVAELCRKTRAAELPGSVGIAHSRSMGNIPLDTWAHPFPAACGCLLSVAFFQAACNILYDLSLTSD